MSDALKRLWPLLALCVFAAIGIVYVGGRFEGERRGEERGLLRAQAQVREIDETEAKIMAYVLKRNPEATYREFNGFARLVMDESSRAGIDFRLVMAMIDKESQFNPRAVGKAGEIGLMQVMPATGALVAKALGIPFEGPNGKNLGTLANPRDNLRIGIRFLKDRVEEFGGVNPTAIRAYNRGSATAREYRPHDRYAEDIGLKYITLAAVIR